MGFIHIYKVFDTSRKTKTYRSDSLLKRVKINEEGNVSLGNGTYRVDADKSGHETRTKFLLFKVPAFVHYYRQGNPEPMDPIGFGFDTDIPASHMKIFADSNFIRHLFKADMDYTTILLMLSLLGNLLLGVLIYSLIKK